jgi:hypothetical protein
MIWWLILVYHYQGANIPPLLHVGNFNDKPACEAAAQSASVPVTPVHMPPIMPTFICVQASAPGGPPPPT